MEVSARFDAMMAASNQCTSAGVKLFDIQRAVGHACILAASATGDAGATAEIVRFCDHVSRVMDDTTENLLDVARGLRTALDAMWTAAGGSDGDVPGPVTAPRPGRPL
jgi:hypothetical protein